MSVRYIIVPYKIPSKPDAPVTYYPRIKSTGEITLRELVDDIADISTLSQADMMGAIESLIQRIPKYLEEGKIVRLGDLGSFFLSLEGEGAADPTEVRASKIKRARLRFRAGQLLSQHFKHLSYTRD
jgi:predicted histone-like DNA-binding protein